MKRIHRFALFASLALASGCYANEAPPTTTTAATVRPSPSAAPAAGPTPSSSEPSPTLAPEVTPSEGTTSPHVEIVPEPSDRVDAGITVRLRDRIAADPALSPQAKSVRILTRGRKVVLEGRVPTEYDHAVIVAMARDTPGVVAIDDRIVVGP